jgi:hypothetical protein
MKILFVAVCLLSAFTLAQTAGTNQPQIQCQIWITTASSSTATTITGPLPTYTPENQMVCSMALTTTTAWSALTRVATDEDLRMMGDRIGFVHYAPKLKLPIPKELQ